MLAVLASWLSYLLILTVIGYQNGKNTDVLPYDEPWVGATVFVCLVGGLILGVWTSTTMKFNVWWSTPSPLIIGFILFSIGNSRGNQFRLKEQRQIERMIEEAEYNTVDFDVKTRQ